MIETKIIKEITPTFLEEILSRYFNHKCPRIIKLNISSLQGGFLNNFGSQIIRISIVYECQEQSDYPTTVILKANPSDMTTYNRMLTEVKHSQSPKSIPFIPNMKLNYREILSYRCIPKLVNIGMPTIYHTILDEDNDRLWIIMEDLKGSLLLNAARQRAWSKKWLFRAMEDLALFHATWWNNTMTWKECDWIFKDSPDWIKHTEVAIESNKNLNPRFVTNERYRLLRKMLELLPSLEIELSEKTTTLIHGDCSSRNACFKVIDGIYRLTLFDWSFTSVSHPGVDISKLLLTTLSPKNDWSLFSTLLCHYFNSLPIEVFKGSYSNFHRGVVLSALVELCNCLMVCAWNNPDREKLLFHDLEQYLNFFESYEYIWSDSSGDCGVGGRLTSKNLMR